MEIQSNQFLEPEQAIIGILRRLPSDKVLQIFDFAKFIEYRYAIDRHAPKTEEEIRVSEEKWDQLFAKPESKRIMREMAKEALVDFHSGQTSDIGITEDGRLTPQ